jgi:hypothetical protein
MAFRQINPVFFVDGGKHIAFFSDTVLNGFGSKPKVPYGKRAPNEDELLLSLRPKKALPLQKVLRR